jgi:NAD(P)-dependent dehydrogenase (short-subunit alcohol dehydrogenase family)
MPVNFTGTYAAIRAFVPVLIANGGGHIVNVLSLLSLASSRRWPANRRRRRRRTR